MAIQDWQMIPRTNRILLLLIFLLISTSFIRAETIPGLGTATFPTSTHSAPAAREFVRGLLLLHLFEYDDAKLVVYRRGEGGPRFCDGVLGRGDDLQSSGLE